jgi:hypothetical protein
MTSSSSFIIYSKPKVSKLHRLGVRVRVRVSKQQLQTLPLSSYVLYTDRYLTVLVCIFARSVVRHAKVLRFRVRGWVRVLCTCIHVREARCTPIQDVFSTSKTYACRNIRRNIHTFKEILKQRGFTTTSMESYTYQTRGNFSWSCLKFKERRT